MLRSFAVVSVLTSMAFAQSSSSASGPTASATPNPLIPTGISSPCSTFLNELNADTSIAKCLSAMNGATSAFAAGSDSTPSSASVTSALTNLCSDSVSNSCPESLIREKTAKFYTSCPAELTTSPNSDVKRIYDVLYVLTPFQKASCSKDDSGKWCVLAPSTSAREVSDEVDQSSSLGLSELLSYLSFNAGALKRRADASAVIPNITTFHNTNLPFLFLTPDLDATKLCTTCTRDVLTAYINFESNMPYAPGLPNSQILATQTPLYDSIKAKCPANFLSGAVQAAGGISTGNNPLGSAAVPAFSSEPRNFLALVMGLATLAVSSVAL